MLYIGFTEVYFTLWSGFTNYVTLPTGEKAPSSSAYTFVKNLSIDFDRAVDKVKALGEDFEIDLSIRGLSNFVRYYPIPTQINEFSFGKLKGQSIVFSSDVWQLERAMKEEPNLRTRVYARRRLIDLGELVRYSHIDHNGVSQKYIKRSEIDAHTYNANKGHYFEEGKRVEIEVRQCGKLSYFDTSFGTTFIQRFITRDNKALLYKGGSPINFGEEDYMTIKATVLHEEYRGEKQTRLQRIKY